MHILPSGVKPSFSDNDVEIRAMILAYSQVRESDDMDILEMQMKSRS